MAAVSADERPGRRGARLARLPFLLLFHVAPAVLFIIVAWLNISALSAYIGRGAGDDAGAGLTFAAGILYRVLVILFLGLAAALFALRRPPKRRLNDPVATAVALAGTFGLTFVASAPATTDDGRVYALANVFLILGNGSALIALWQLGRNLSITPAARNLVTSGVYGVVRHPLYAAEIIAGFGSLLPALSAPSAAIFAVFVGLQVWRTVYEERVLTSVFPEYADYRRSVPRLLPRLGWAGERGRDGS